MVHKSTGRDGAQKGGSTSQFAMPPGLTGLNTAFKTGERVPEHGETRRPIE